MVMMWQLFFVDLVDERGQGRGLSAPGRSGDEHQARAEFRGVRQLRRQIERLEVGYLARNDAHHDGATSSLREDVHAEARELRDAVRDVAGAVLLDWSTA